MRSCPICENLCMSKTRMAAICNDERVEVREISGSKGKGLFAKTSFKTGDVIIEERPLVCCQFLWNAVYGYAACDYCLKSLETAEENVIRLLGKPYISLPYPQCCETKQMEFVSCPDCEVMFCSEECRKSAYDEYHKVLCFGNFDSDLVHPIEELQKAWRKIHYPPESANIMLLARIIAMIVQSDDREGTLNLFRQFVHQTVNEEEKLAHNLLGSHFQDRIELLRKLMLKAVPCDCEEWLTPAGFRSLLVLVGRNAQGVGTSPLALWIRNCKKLKLGNEEQTRLTNFLSQLYDEIRKESGGFIENEGSALYVLQSKCNHSCVPNTAVRLPYGNSTLVLTALEDIPEGTELCISYIDDRTRNKSRHSRVKIFKGNYLFTCMCPKCIEQLDDPDVTSDEEKEDEAEERGETDSDSSDDEKSA